MKGVYDLYMGLPQKAFLRPKGIYQMKKGYIYTNSHSVQNADSDELFRQLFS